MPEAQPFDFRSANQIGQDQLRPLSRSQEAFARNLSEGFGGSLGVALEVGLKSAEQLSYRRFLEQLPNPAYVFSMQVDPAGAALIHIDHSILLPLVDILLGGAGTPSTGARELTELEDRIVMEIAKGFCGQLQEAWKDLAFTVHPGRRCSPLQLQRLLPNAETTLCFSFQAKLPDCEGSFQLVLSAACSTGLQRKLCAEIAEPADVVVGKQPSQVLRERLLQCKFGIELELSRAKVQANDLIHLQPGDILPLQVPVNQAATLVIGNKEVFRALPVRSGLRRAAHVANRIPTARTEKVSI